VLPTIQNLNNLNQYSTGDLGLKEVLRNGANMKPNMEVPYGANPVLPAMSVWELI